MPKFITKLTIIIFICYKLVKVLELLLCCIGGQFQDMENCVPFMLIILSFAKVFLVKQEYKSTVSFNPPDGVASF